MNELRVAMRERWDTKGDRYDHACAHGIKDPGEKARWVGFLRRLGNGPLDVLDVGTGTGFVALILAEMGHRVTGIDWSTTMLAQAEAKAREDGLRITLRQGDAESLPFPEGSFDAVVARHLLWTLVEPRQALAEWYRVLKPHGRVIADFSRRRGKAAGHHYPVEVEEKLPLNRDVDPGEVAGLFEEVGFTDLRVESSPILHDGEATTYLLSGQKPSEV